MYLVHLEEKFQLGILYPQYPRKLYDCPEQNERPTNLKWTRAKVRFFQKLK